MRCAAIHRKLGTHISKVKSLSMDSWSNEQVDVSRRPCQTPIQDHHELTNRQNMRKVGNVASNNIYNSGHTKPPVPVDADEADSAMERFIRKKYMNNTVKVPGKPRSPNLSEETPPPLPPKNSSKFGFRSASSIFPLSSKSKKEARAFSATQVPHSNPSPRSNNKPSKIFGATFDIDQPDETEQKLGRLRDMGFQDSKRNALVLKGVNGNLERAIETLVRLGEGSSRPSPLPSPAPRGPTLRTSRSLTPLTTSSGGLGLGAGLSVPPRSATDRPISPSSTSTNPFDNLGPAQPQTAQSTGNLQNKNPYGQTDTNPFGVPTQTPTDAFNQAFQNMALSPPQPLFPHHTGGASTQPVQQQPASQQPTVPSGPTSPGAYQPMAFDNNMTYPQPVQQQPTGYNPFFSNPPNLGQQQPQQAVSSMSVNTNQPQNGYNPFARSPTRIASPSLGQIPEQTQMSYASPPVFQGSVYQSPAPMNPPETGTNPFFSSLNQSAAQMGQQAFSQQQMPLQQTTQPMQQSYGQQQYGQQPFVQQTQAPQQQQQPYFYQPQRPDKASIMALYSSYSQPAAQQPITEPVQPQALPVQPLQHTQLPQPAFPSTIPENQNAQLATPPTAQTHSVPQPLSPSTNPFLGGTLSNSAFAATTNTATDPFAARSRESMNLGLDLAWTNGRHSPDAFASLSARHA